MVSVMSTSRYVTSASGYQSWSSIYIGGLISRNNSDCYSVVTKCKILLLICRSESVFKCLSSIFHRCDSNDMAPKRGIYDIYNVCTYHISE